MMMIITSILSNIRLDHPRHMVCGAIWRALMKIADGRSMLNRHLRPFCSCDLCREPMTSISEFDP